MPRQRVEIAGIVQGVGFRPFVYQLALANGLSGWVQNVGAGVCVEVQGTTDALTRFCQQLLVSLPPLAKIEMLHTLEIPDINDSIFCVLPSELSTNATSPIPPDVAICNDCQRELNDPLDRRFRYPFINCTNCGPRFTIIDSLPYDRRRTTMNGFAMCEACRCEYEDPTNRRHHAQPNACPICGPQIWWHVGERDSKHDISQPSSCAKRGEQALLEFSNAIKGGKIVAVKGIGGFHLACDATNADAVQELRKRKGRFERPFAIMMPSLDACADVVLLNSSERSLLASPARPIVLARKRVVKEPSFCIAESVAPNNESLGVMLPYSPLHFLLAKYGVPLVLTSGNLSDEPIAFENLDAVTRLSQLADAFLLNDRPIRCPCDDSVVRVVGTATIPLRRSRGYAPLPIEVGNAIESALPASSILGIGGEVKNTFCIWRPPHAYMSQHIGDMGNIVTLDSLEQSIQRLTELYQVHWNAVAVDLHPGSHASRFGRTLASKLGVPCFGVQHHHAHLASLAVEHGLAADESLLGFCFDGTGYGTDRNIWGGELLHMCGLKCERLAHLEYVRLPTGDSNMRKPYRMALSYLAQMELPWDERLASVCFTSPEELRVLRQQLRRELNCISTSSMGRLFDVVASLLGLCQVASYEGQAAIELESLAWKFFCGCSDPPRLLAAQTSDTEYRFHSNVTNRSCEGVPLAGGSVTQGMAEPCMTIGIKKLLEAIYRDVLNGLAKELIAFKFHRSIADLIGRLGSETCELVGVRRVGLTGGVFQNGLLLHLAINELNQRGIEVLTHRQVPANDGGLALGQAWIGSLMLEQAQGDKVS